MLKFSQPYQITPNKPHHFFGYYGIPPWDINDRYYICLETPFQDHMPKPGERADIILIDLKDGTNRKIANTQAWNFQQGAMIHWLPSEPDKKIVYNDIDEQGFCSFILDVFTGDKRRLPRPINAVAHTKDLALCINFSRLQHNRPVCGYSIEENYPIGIHPNNDGIYIMDLQTGNSRLIITLDEIWKENEVTASIPDEEFEGFELWFNHLSFNKNDTRFFFLARFPSVFGAFNTSMWTANIDGTDKYLLVDYYKQLSHFEWINEKEIIVTMNVHKDARHTHVLLDDKKGNPRYIAPDILKRNGHPHISPNGLLMATDCYPIEGKRYVYIVELENQKVHTVAEFDNPKEINGNLRCDPHPRWNHQGNILSFDGIGPNGRQIYFVNVM